MRGRAATLPATAEMVAAFADSMRSASWSMGVAALEPLAADEDEEAAAGRPP